ncbi:hypothetical protein SLEP1_g52378 [Rubroshorea leprosula]|uniref:Uncharacterized protein n=1 Tax=Rubroshorea leprosula TaxID=152421 RepID=A0AAV5M6V0_9ROSI|nr:hypothetical protein SLEP1_g52378 [Rubroshorea leprosula]
MEFNKKLYLFLKENCQRTGIKLIAVPNRWNDTAGKAILVDMFMSALDNPPLRLLDQCGYSAILLFLLARVFFLPCAMPVCLGQASVAHGRGEGFFPPPKL